MNYYKPTEMSRVEEGPAIASKYPIISADYLILSRNISDSRDEHQRVCLHVATDIPGWGVVDIFTVHLSLLEEARNNSVVELWNLVTDRSVSKGVTQILMGDLNAE
jgi:endonuclease/exonuclease/phosphatase family metal-dependent hydrolase